MTNQFYTNIINIARDKRAISGRSSVWLERYLGVVEAASSSLVTQTSKKRCIYAGFCGCGVFAFLLHFCGLVFIWSSFLKKPCFRVAISTITAHAAPFPVPRICCFLQYGDGRKLNITCRELKNAAAFCFRYSVL